MSEYISRVENPLFWPGIEIPDGGLRARHLKMEVCSKFHAVFFVREWHSRLPNCQNGPWQYAFKMTYMGVTFAVALWNNPSARTLPSHWLELRRMACSPDVPKFTASRFLSLMVKYFMEHSPKSEKLISYQDVAVHQGTIYKAAGWTPEYISKFRVRDRSKNRVGTNRLYRSSLNGIEPDASPKVRWAILLDKKSTPLIPVLVSTDLMNTNVPVAEEIAHD